jgi:hypothetical protein
MPDQLARYYAGVIPRRRTIASRFLSEDAKPHSLATVLIGWPPVSSWRLKPCKPA